MISSLGEIIGPVNCAAVITPETLTLSNSVWPSISTCPLASISPVNVDTPVIAS